MCCALNMFQRLYHVISCGHIERRITVLPCVKEEPFTNFEEEGQQSHLHNTTSSFSPVGKCADKEGNLYVRHRETQQTDQLNTSNTSLFPHSQPSHKEGISPNSSRGGKQMDQLNSMSSCLPGSLYTKKEENFDNHQRKNQQTDQLNISNPFYLPLSQHSQKEGISTNNSRDGEIDQLDTSSSSSLPLGQHSYDKATSKNRERDNQRTHECNTSNLSSPQSHPAEGISIAFQGEETAADQPDASSCPSDQLVLFGLSLSVSEKDFLQKFACLTNAKLIEEWSKDVTHVIVAKGAGSSWSRSFEVLMAILLGRWVVHFEWVAGCLGTHPGPEASYEVAFSMDSVRTINGPKKGRMRAAEGAPNLFSGLCFCLSDYMNPDNRDRMRDLIASTEGRVLERRDLHLQLIKNPDDDSSVRRYFVYDVDAPEEFSLSTLRKEMEEVREQAAAGAQVICHLKVLDAIAAYDAEILNAKDSFTS
ncbi:unnamed protein product [Miscanthus lutarioriparius]|uniref:BRCT domain-containing protein n=1 Tax=Miscanthus lutarioriparius TaxID=422564 RepID=A0A811RMP7_9POAL|nr:unnamed protein product [Miscanthus lutarioriparius]